MAGKKSCKEAMGEIPKKDGKILEILHNLQMKKKTLPRKIVEPLPHSPKKINGPSLITCLEYEPYHGLIRHLEVKANTSGNYRVSMKIPC